MNLIKCGHSVKNNMLSSAPHCHDGWEIMYNLYGTVTATVDGVSYLLSPQDIIVAPPRAVHSGRSKEGYGDVYVQAKNLDLKGVVTVRDHDGAIRHLIEMLAKLSAEENPSASNLIDSLLDSICQYINHYRMSGNGHPAVIALKDAIYEHVSDSEFSLTEEIRSLGFDEDYIRRIFKKQTGKTPSEYLTHLRIKMAKELLLSHNFNSVNAVAEGCGFKDSYYFSTCFKKNTGISPLQYRKCNTFETT